MQSQKNKTHYPVRLTLADKAKRMRYYLPQYGKQIKDAVSVCFADAKEIFVGRDMISFFTPYYYDNAQLENFNKKLSSLLGQGESGLFAACPNTFYAGATDYIQEPVYPYRQGISYEIIFTEDIDIFFDEYAQKHENINIEPLKSVLSFFFKSGIDGVDFQKVKCTYLGTIKCYYFEIYFGSALMDYFPVGEWYLISLDEDGAESSEIIDKNRYYTDSLTDCGISFGQILSEYNPDTFFFCPGLCYIYPVNESMSDKLKTLFKLVSIEGNPKSRFQSDTGAPFEPDASSDAILPCTVFNRATVYNIGQALCVGVFSAARIEAFFDFGLPHVAGGYNANAAVAPSVPAIGGLVHGIAVTGADPVIIILSHWHYDHFLFVRALYDINPAYLLSLSWEVPQTYANITSHTVQNYILSLANTGVYSGGFHVNAGGFAETPLSGNNNLLYSKMNFNPGHPHHHGLYAQLRLESGNRMFLSGDCTYEGLVNNEETGMPNAAGGRDPGYHYLQASHHGGNYSYAPAHRSSNDMPAIAPAAPVTPPPAAPNTYHLIFSTGAWGNNFGMPKAYHVDDAHTRGWLNAPVSCHHDTKVFGDAVMT